MFRTRHLDFPPKLCSNSKFKPQPVEMVARARGPPTSSSYSCGGRGRRYGGSQRPVEASCGVRRRSEAIWGIDMLRRRRPKLAQGHGRYGNGIVAYWHLAGWWLATCSYRTSLVKLDSRVRVWLCETTTRSPYYPASVSCKKWNGFWGLCLHG